MIVVLSKEIGVMKKGLVFKIIVTILQIIIIPCCIVDSWATVYTDQTGNYFDFNFIDAADLFGADYLATGLVWILAVVVIIMIWTPAGKAAFIPAILQTLIFIASIISVMSNEDAEIKSFAFLHTGIAVVALVVCIIAGVTVKTEIAEQTE